MSTLLTVLTDAMTVIGSAYTLLSVVVNLLPAGKIRSVLTDVVADIPSLVNDLKAVDSVATTLDDKK